MVKFKHPVQDVIRSRTSARTYEKRLISRELIDQITQCVSGIDRGPLGSKIRFQFEAAAESDFDTLKGLGTYGVIRNPAGFIIGAVDPGTSGNGLVDFGYQMESIVLFLADLGLGTCWIGGSFRKSRFAERINLQNEEIVPSVISTGYARSNRSHFEKLMRLAAGSKNRKPWEALFFCGDFDHALASDALDGYTSALEMVRLGPSTSNRQPWRVVFDPEKNRFHFFVQRSKGFRPEKIGMADLPRVDMGIAMCHFELTAREARLAGRWVIDAPQISGLPLLTSYMATWEAT